MKSDEFGIPPALMREAYAWLSSLDEGVADAHDEFDFR